MMETLEEFRLSHQENMARWRIWWDKVKKTDIDLKRAKELYDEGYVLQKHLFPDSQMMFLRFDPKDVEEPEEIFFLRIKSLKGLTKAAKELNFHFVIRHHDT